MDEIDIMQVSLSKIHPYSKSELHRSIRKKYFQA